MTADLVERAEALAALGTAIGSIGTQASGGGRIALLAGEAGIGKTSLLRAFAATRPETSVWWGACDALGTPHPLAPLLDVARERRPRFAARLDGPRPALFEAVLDDLRLAAEPVLVVIEDAHWADDATLDWLKYLGRRIERTRALLAVSWRDDEVGATHPLRRVIGEWPASARRQIPIDRLSPAAVETLARRAGRSDRGLHAATQGNAFFVTELLRDAREPRPAVPASVQDLVLARYARLSPGAQALLRAVAVMPGRAERDLVEALAAPSLDSVEAALGSGLVTVDETQWSYRHELGRVAIETSLAAPVAQALHAQVLAALVAAGESAPARCVHHALRARDPAAVGRFAPLAAEQASARGAHREAAAQWRAALEQGSPADAAEHRRWLEQSAVEHSLVGRFDVALEQRRILERMARDRGDRVEAALQLSRQGSALISRMQHDEASRLNRAALALLEPLPPGRVHAYAAYSEAFLRMLDRDCDESVEWAGRAIELANGSGDESIAASSRGVLGTALLFIRYEDGVRTMLQAAAEHEAAGQLRQTAMVYSNLGSGSGEVMQLPNARRWLDQALTLAIAHEFDGTADYCRAWLALVALFSGRWSEAADRAAEVIERPGASDVSRMMALLALGRLRSRRGDPGAGAALDEALQLTGEHNALQRIGPLRAARAEAALAHGDVETARAEVAAALPLALSKRQPWLTGDLVWQGFCAGSVQEPPPHCAEPFALEIAGRWRDAAEAWQRLGCPYERARALAAGDDEAALREALGVFEGLGARPAADALRERLKQSGLRGLPPQSRGPRASTREHAFGLTAREQQVLDLLCAGLRNAEIAARLHRSVRTVDHHVAAVFAKLGVDSRVAAVRAATRAGLQSGQAPAAK